MTIAAQSHGKVPVQIVNSGSPVFCITIETASPSATLYVVPY